ncbi:prepilin-type N-terminal cleavage/methylation domain-containing protein [Kangiella sp. HD9-110m-PIT-SAG07]|nr:prepilin-type N-terminal cleavage/methylation domain-containing protein [Kangiella sp. HD9-110m-PIT-SAG07]
MKELLTMQSNKGFTLIELLVGMVLSLLLVAAGATVYLSSKKTNAVNQNILNIQNDGQLALQVLKNDIRLAGWTKNDLQSQSMATPLGAGFQDGGGTASDTLAIQYEGDSDCNGTAVTNTVINVYSLNAGTLMCNGQPMIDGVESFQVLYGYSGAGGGVKYVTADNVADPTAVESVRFAILLRSERAVPDGPASRDYTVLDQQLTGYTDKKIRQVYTATVAILNRPHNLLEVGS